jgi:hypothetical protein
VPTSGGITQARHRLGYEPVKGLFAGVAVAVAEELTAGAFLGPWGLMAIDGFEWDAPDTEENAAAFGFAGITRRKHLNPRRRHRTYPRVVKRARHNSYRVKRPGDHGTRHPGPATISLVNHRRLTLAA